MRIRFLLLIAFMNFLCLAPSAETLQADLLIVGGTESGCAAAIQAARMGVASIVLVNDTEWLGGQFSSEALAAIDESRGPAGYDQTVPFPRSGLFKEVIDRIEAQNERLYGERRPGNTRVITTSRPSDSARVFEDMVQPYVDSGQLRILTPWHVARTQVRDDRLGSVTFKSADAKKHMIVEAKLTIDASDWGDVVKASGAGYEFGPDLQATYGEPLAPDSREGYPLTDMNPLTYCMIIEETDHYEPIPEPANYDPRNYRDHAYPRDPLWLYPTRRIIDRYGFETVTHPDVLLLCFPAFDYPTDVWPAQVAEALEATESGASTKNIAELTRAQRQIVYEDAKRFSLGFLYYLQTEVHDSMEDTTHSFRRFKLSDEFDTHDNLPPKPYLRESLRTKAMYMTRQQDTTGHGALSTNFATVMFHDGVLSWQFEYDFHPTGRKFLDDDSAGPWQNYFRPNRTWGPPYSGKCNFPLRSFVPETLDGLLVAQKNLGYTSLVSSALRLHDQSMAVGQAAGSIAAVALTEKVAPRTLPYDRERLTLVQRAMCSSLDGGVPASIWPFADLKPSHPAYTAVNMLGATGALAHGPDEVRFRADEPATDDWRAAIVARSMAAREYDDAPSAPEESMTRGAFAMAWWEQIRDLPMKPFARMSDTDADGDGILDGEDALLFSPAASSWPEYKPKAYDDGLPDPIGEGRLVKQINFTGKGAKADADFVSDVGEAFSDERGYGWETRQLGNHRVRNRLPEPMRDSFQFTRSHARWELALPLGDYEVTVCVGDSGHAQAGQHVAVEGRYWFTDVSTSHGMFYEHSETVSVRDGRLTIDIGRPGSTTNTCINWIRVVAR